MIFAYKGYDHNGKKVSDKLEANSLAEAKLKLRSKKIIYNSIKEEGDSLFANLSLKREYIISSKELANLSRELAMYMKSGMSIVNAMRVVKTHYEDHKHLNLFLTTISVHLDEGKDFYSALEAQQIVKLPEFFKQSIKVSEHSGILDEVLLELSRFLKEQDKINKEVKGAFAYPSFILVVSFLMVAFMLSFVVPQITSIFDNMNQKLPDMTIFVIALGDFFANNYVNIFLAIFALSTTFSLLLKFNYHFKYLVHSLVLKVPLLGSIVLKNELARFSYIGSLLVRSGVSVVSTINLGSNILNNVVIKQYFSEASKKVVEGKKLSTALLESGFKLDKPFIQALALGEETSQVERVLANVAELYFEENRDRMTLMLAFLEPVLMLLVGGAIGFIVMAILLPIFSMSIQ
ncbi:MAG: type II secretion system F family protein [Helicobacteraceae bacterium]|nr:type II secretion system F family protein [Helicobacteraceae bacterium]